MKTEDGLTFAELSAQKEKEKKAKNRKTLLLSVGAAVIGIGLIVALLLVLRTDKQKKVEAQFAADYDVTVPIATVGENQVSVPMFNYCYMQTCNQYGSYLSYLLDTTKSFSEQYYDEANGMTWEDYFVGQTEQALTEYYSVYDSAVAEGYTLTEEQQATVEEAITSIEDEAKNAGFTKTDNYVAAMFGKGCNLANYREYLEFYQTYAGYYQQKADSFTPTADEVNAAYAKDPGAVDEITCSYKSFAGKDYMPEPEATEATDAAEATEATEATEAPAVTEDALKQAKADADKAAKTFPDDATSSTTTRDSFTGTVSEEAATWLFDSARKEGDIKVFANTAGDAYYTVRYESRDVHDYNPVNAYVVTIPFDSTETTAAADAEAKKSAEEIYNTIVAGLPNVKTDEEFVSLVSPLTTSGTTLSEDITKKSYKDASGDFLFDAARKAGDTEAFTLDSSYRIVRYVSTSETTYQYNLMESKLKNDAFTAWHDGVTEGYTIEMDNTMLPFATTDLKLNSSQN